MKTKRNNGKTNATRQKEAAVNKKDKDALYRDEKPQTLEELQTEKIKMIEHFYNALENGKSFEEIEIMIDISAAAGRVPESSQKISHEGLDLIKQAHRARLNRNYVISALRRIAKGDARR